MEEEGVRREEGARGEFQEEEGKKRRVGGRKGGEAQVIPRAVHECITCGGRFVSEVFQVLHSLPDAAHVLEHHSSAEDDVWQVHMVRLVDNQFGVQGQSLLEGTVRLF